MMCGNVVQIHGLNKATELNGEKGIVTKVGLERATVCLEMAGRIVSVRLSCLRRDRVDVTNSLRGYNDRVISFPTATRTVPIPAMDWGC